LQRAVECARIYKGDLLEDWDVEWCRLEREELRRRYLDGLHSLGEVFEQRGRYDLALAYRRRAVEVDPLNETAQRNLIRLLQQSGNRAAAVTQLNVFARLCHSELGIEPDSETLALREALGPARAEVSPRNLDRATTGSIRLERAPLIGRVQERIVIAQLLEETARGTGESALLIGEVGIGKSRLADWAVEEWVGRGGALGLGRCIEFNEPVPYQPVFDAVAQILDPHDLAELLGQFQGVAQLSESEEALIGHGAYAGRAWLADRTRMFTRLVNDLKRAATGRPLLIVIEDIQWADAGTMDFVSYLLGRIPNIPVGVILTSRSVGDHRTRRNSDRAARNSSYVLRLASLSRREMIELAQFHLGRAKLPKGLSDWLYDETEGNPLFLVETVRLSQQRALGSIFPSASDSTRDSDLGARRASLIPAGVRAAVEQRLTLLHGAPKRVAQLASVLGRSFGEELLDMLADMSGPRLSRAIVQLIIAGIFERDSGGYRFVHDKIRAVCYESLNSKTKRSYHARTATVLAQMPGIPIQSLAWHQDSACQWRLATESWELAGDQAKEVYAYEEAANAYRRALFALQKDKALPASRSASAEMTLLFKLDKVLLSHGNPDDWDGILNRLGSLCRRSGRSELIAAWYLRAAIHEEHCGRFSQGAGLARRAWFLARSAGDRDGEVDALRVLAWVFNRAGRHDRSIAVSKLALEKIGDSRPPVLVSTLWQAAAAHLKRSRYQAASAYLQRAETIALGLGLRTELHHIATLQAIIDKWTGRIVASKSGLLRALELASEASDFVAKARAEFHLATLDVLTGNPGGGLRRLRDATLTSRSAGYTRTHLACLNEVAHGIGRVLGNHSWARSALSHALRLAEGSGSVLLAAMCRDSLAALLFDEGRLDEALVVIDDVLRLLRSARGSMGPNQESLARRGAILLGLGRVPEAIVDLEAARQRQSEMGDRLILVDTLTSLALAYLRNGDPERARSTSEDALRVLTESDYANMQPQRVFWHHYLILEGLKGGAGMRFLDLAAKHIADQAQTLSRAQQYRFCQRVSLNRTILETWMQQSKDAACFRDPEVTHSPEAWHRKVFRPIASRVFPDVLGIDAR
jgi:tetratricopeptide (TPR) repeat protein